MIISYLHIFFRKIIHILLKGIFYIALTLCINISSNLFAHDNPTKPIKPAHYRGLFVLNDSIAWFSGSKGTVIRTTDGGRNFDTISPLATNTKLAYFLPYGNQTVENYNRVSDASISLQRKDYRDIWAKNDKEAVIMSAGDSAVILKTIDGGEIWTIVYTDFRKDIFLDALEIDSKTGVGMVLGDPIIPEPIIVEVNGNSNQFVLIKKLKHKTKSQDPNIAKKKLFAALYTIDFGNSWNPLPVGDWNLPLDSLESFFAASGTSLVIIESKVTAPKKNASSKKNDTSEINDVHTQTEPPQFKSLTVGFAGGGINPSYHIVKFKNQKQSTIKQNKRVHLSTNQPRIVANESISLPFDGGAGSGVYGICLSDAGIMLAVGGNYTLPDSCTRASAHSTTNNFGLKWSGAHGTQGNTGGYRSGVCISRARPLIPGIHESLRIKTFQRIAICTGTNGSDISFDNGINWLNIPKQTLKSGLEFNGSYNACVFSENYLWMVGNSGKFIRISIEDLKSMAF